MIYYIDGDYGNPINNSSSEDCFYSSIYSSKNTTYKPVLLPSELQKNIDYSAFNDVVEFYNNKESIFNNFEKKTGVDLWFFEHFRIYFSYKTFLLRMACIKQFLNKYPEGIIVTSDSRLERYIDVKSILNIPAQKRSDSKKKSPLKELLFILRRYKRTKNQVNENLILSRIEDDVNGLDQRFGELERSCDKLLNRDVFNSNKKLPKNIKKYKEEPNVDTLLARYILSFRSPLAILNFRKEMKILFNSLAEDTCEEKRNELVILDLLKKGKFSYFIYYLKYKSFDQFFKSKNYKGVLMINENSAQQKAVQYAAVKNSVRVYAFQHGAIYDLHPAYMYGAYNNKPLLATVTFTWGNYFTRLLTTEGGYKKNQVITAGRIEPSNEERTVNKALQTNKEIIVYATQPQPDATLRIRELKDVFVAAKECQKRYLLVLRPHPAELDDTFFINIANEIEFDSFVIDRKSDLKTHFEYASLLITSYSTVGAEFIPYYKPLLVLDYLKADKVDYIKQGVGIPVYNGEELINVLKNRKHEINQIAFDKFVADYFYKNGEKALEIVQNELANNRL